MTSSAGLLEVSQIDAALVARARAGDLAAFARLMALHRPKLERYAFFLLGNREDAEEALQDAFVRAFRALDQCHDPAQVGSWMFRILMNRCRSRLARVDLIDHGASAEAAYAAAPADGGWAQLDRREEIDLAVAELSPDQREAFLLKYVENFSYSEMAALTGVPVPALKMRVLRACDRLRKRLEERHRDPA